MKIQPQPDDATCGPACLHAVYRFYGDRIPLRQVIEEVQPLEEGGTLAVLLAHHALRRGYGAAIYTYNIDMFDPTWFGRTGVDLAERLKMQARVKSDPKLRWATDAYLEFLTLGGRLCFRELSTRLIRGFLQRGQPILTGLSATYLYECAREYGTDELVYDDVRGEPTGHFVVLHGYERMGRLVQVADPFNENPRFERHHYAVEIERVIGAILLGVLTYDANLLVLDPPRRSRARA